MTDVYVINEEIKKMISELKNLGYSRVYSIREEWNVLNKPTWWLSEFPEVIFSELEGDTRLGYFSKGQNLIVLNAVLTADNLEEERKSVFLHELAHWLAYFKFGSGAPAHGCAFKAACQKLGVPEEFEGAVAKIQDWASKQKKAESKVKKLVALSASPFEAEADSAMNKAKEMMDQYSLQYLFEDDNRLFGIDLNTYKRLDSWKTNLARLVADLSGCYRIIVRTYLGSHISYYGSRDQVETALYFQLYFEEALDNEYQKNRKRLHGITEKNSFLNGLVSSLYRKAFTTGKTTSIIQSQKKSGDRYNEIYEGKIRVTHSSARAGEGYYLGSSVGKSMEIPNRQSACKVRRIGNV